MTRALLEQALEALECAYSENYDGAKIHGAKVAIRAHLAQPAWHDAPTVPGLWWVAGTAGIFHIDEAALPIYKGSAHRWFGPIPPDSGDKP
jgi:hypothetical protein